MLKLKEQTEIYRFIKLSLPGGDKKTISGRIITSISPLKMIILHISRLCNEYYSFYNSTKN
jgi:hypothetical protein